MNSQHFQFYLFHLSVCCRLLCWHGMTQWVPVKVETCCLYKLAWNSPGTMTNTDKKAFSCQLLQYKKRTGKKKSKKRPQMTAKFASLSRNLLHILLKHADSLTTNSDHIKVTTLVSLSHFHLSHTKPPCLCLCLYVQHLKVVFWIVLSCVVCFELFFFLPSWCWRKIVNAQSGSRVWHRSCLKVRKQNPSIVNGKGKCKKRFSLRLWWSNSSYCNAAFALIFFFPQHWRNW